MRYLKFYSYCDLLACFNDTPTRLYRHAGAPGLGLRPSDNAYGRHFANVEFQKAVPLIEEFKCDRLGIAITNVREGDVGLRNLQLWNKIVLQRLEILHNLLRDNLLLLRINHFVLDLEKGGHWLVI